MYRKIKTLFYIAAYGLLFVFLLFQDAAAQKITTVTTETMEGEVGAISNNFICIHGGFKNGQ